MLVVFPFYGFLNVLNTFEFCPITNDSHIILAAVHQWIARSYNRSGVSPFPIRQTHSSSFCDLKRMPQALGLIFGVCGFDQFLGGCGCILPSGLRVCPSTQIGKYWKGWTPWPERIPTCSLENPFTSTMNQMSYFILLALLWMQLFNIVRFGIDSWAPAGCV